MIPIRLELKNFLPYRAPDALYFDGIHLACLTGNNGAGKSSLLDAITWALWGKARTRSDDDLIHLGQDEMYVQLDFEQEGTHYRVIRRRTAGKRGHGNLDLFSVRDDGEMQTLTEPSMRMTQASINTILRLEYDTFVHSAFLQQGKADAFTTKRPAERKKILSEILGLAQWQVYEERTKEKLKEIDRSLASIEAVMATIDEELAHEAAYQRERDNAQAAFDAAKSALDEAEAHLKAIGTPEDQLKYVRENQAAHERRIAGYERDLESVAQDIAARQQKIAQLEATLAQEAQIETGYQALREARAIDSELGKKLSDIRDIDDALNDLNRQLAAEKSRLEVDQRGYETTVQELQRALTGDSAEALAQIKAQIAELEALERERDDLHDTNGTLKEERSSLNARQDALTDEGTRINERMAQLEATEGATCPVCGQPLAEAQREQLVADLIVERDTMREDYKQITTRMKDIQTTIKANEKRRKALADDIQRLPKLRSQAGALQKQVDDAGAAQKRLLEVQAALDDVLQSLANDDYGHALREQIAEQAARRQVIGYDSDTHSNARETLENYRDYEQQYTKLEIARSALPDEQNALHSAQLRQERIEKALNDESEQLAQLAGQIAELEEKVNEKRQREATVLEQRNITNAANNKLITAQQQLKALDAQRERRHRMEEKLDAVQHEQGIYQELRYAFGKNGVPLMIIETAIPELEAEANQLLARMTDGRMHLRLTTQQEKSSGGVADTLDIEIADELGTRAYELYSGGEAFRINFAIRVALSKMLARRAGAHLRTLFVDEGFGTQDDDGRNKLVEAITAIQDDFDLILVITHIDELRDSFPVHLVVNKTQNGSMITVR